MSWLDDLANKVGISSKSLKLNTAKDKAARAAAEQTALRDAQAQYEAKQLEDLRSGQDAYEQSQQPGILSQAYESALKGLSGIGTTAGNILGNKDLMNLAGAGATYFLTKDQRDAAERAQQEATNLSKQMSYLQDPTVAQIQDDAQNKAYLSQALKGVSDRAAMGLTPQDQADLEKIRNQQNQTFQAQQNAIQENMARRGMGNSGLALAQTMGASQAAGQQAANNATDMASQMFQARQNAAGQLANTAGSALNQQFSRDTTRAGATDQVNQFNTNLQNQRNVNMANAAQNNVKFQQQAGQNKAQSIGGIAQGLGTAIAAGQQNNPTAAFGQQKKTTQQG